MDLEPYAITNENGFIPQNEAHNDFGYMKDTDRKAYNIVTPNSFAYNPARINIGSIGYYEGAENVIVSSLYEVFQTADYIDDRFLWYWFNSNEFSKWIERLQEGSVRLYFYYDKLCECQMFTPSVVEQKKIAEFLEIIDQRIAKQRQIVEALKSYKRGVLSKLFPQKGETKPRYRFEGFTETWEWRRLGEIGKARSGVGFPAAEQGGTSGIPFFKVSDMNMDGNQNEMTVANNYVTDTQITSHRWLPIEKLPAIFFAKVGAAVMLNRKRLCRFPFLLDNNTMAYSLNKELWDADFAKALFDTVDLTSLVQIGALPSYNTGDIESMEIRLPNIDEQRRIGICFKQIDYLITLHQHKLNEFERTKAGLLQQLFI